MEASAQEAAGGPALDRLLGQRIRHRRRTLNLSLTQLAEEAGISIGSLSQIERGLSSPSVRVLSNLANVLQFALSDFFTDATDGSPCREDGIVTRARSRKQLAFWRTGISKELVTPLTGKRGTDLYVILIEPGGTTGAQVYTHAGEDAGYVLEGELELSVSGESYILGRGDGFRFESTLPHSFRNPGRVPTRVLWVNAPATGALEGS
ncbi:cupin domain-containing protein [Pararoseomonas indoligenes]|uniref:Cupin domain-containing protein n=1 Tax=Roseomonas indoligenes TaxID=2820811 RepID=A0A940MZR3_9PROT|nr:cupin domain-containing protein [Pararoseomonas indoligenes]MBP0496354.1 cupin domain-containing protein [Pararoseomonas indoligenes]